MNEFKRSRFTSKHMYLCLAVIVVALIAVFSGVNSGVLLIVLLCPLMMGGMMWMMMGGMNGRKGSDTDNGAPTQRAGS